MTVQGLMLKSLFEILQGMVRNSAYRFCRIISNTLLYSFYL